MNEKVVLVNEHGEVQGLADKLEVHQQGKLHLAFSLMIFRDCEEAGRLTRQYLLQKRAAGKYHCANLWSNTCCSHPHPGETPADAVQRRVGEEMGIHQTLILEALDPVHYRAEMPNGLIEHEYDHVFVSHDELKGFEVNSAEVSDWAWVDVAELKGRLQSQPELFTPWLSLVLQRIEQGAWK